jgi:hypothetical protein
MQLSLRRLTALLGGAMACVDHGTGVEPAARISLRLAAPALNAAASVDLHAFWLRGSAPVTLVRETGPATPGTQSIPLVVDITPCLADGAGQRIGCALLVDVRLLDESGVTVDSVRVGPLDVSPGEQVERAVTLRRVSGVTVQLQPLLDVGDTARAVATVRDAGGTVITGRPVLWSSGNQGVASVDTAGLVTAVSVGTTPITATVDGVSGQVAVSVGPGYFGQVSDATGDGGQPPPPAVPADLVSASVATRSGTLVFSVRFVPGAFDASRTRATFSLDTDLDATTGHPGIASTGTVDATALGVEFVMDCGSAALGGQARVFKYTGPPINTFAAMGQFPVTFLTNGMDVTIPRSAFDADDGLLRFKVVSTIQLSASGFTSILDVMPNIGLAAASTVARSAPGGIVVR